MQRYLIFFLLCSFLVGCAANDADPPAEQPTEQEDGMFGSEEGEHHTTDEQLVESREEVNPSDQTLSITQAEALVYEHLNIDASSDTVVVFDSEIENGDYLIYVYDLLEEDKGTEQHTNEGWYTVNPETKEIKEHDGYQK
jgi:predicted  nucleic acid-binding Zn-ribbon protein